MYAGHLAAGLAIRGRARRVPVAVFLVGTFVLDILWIGFGVLRLDPTPWDDWSHSLLMSIIWATAFAACFTRYGRAAFAAIWVAVFSHYVLDLLVQGASLYPGQPVRDLIPIIVHDDAHLFQEATCVLFLLIFISDERRNGTLSWRSWSVGALVLASNARFLTGI